MKKFNKVTRTIRDDVLGNFIDNIDCADWGSMLGGEPVGCGASPVTHTEPKPGVIRFTVLGRTFEMLVKVTEVVGA